MEKVHYIVLDVIVIVFRVILQECFVLETFFSSFPSSEFRAGIKALELFVIILNTQLKGRYFCRLHIKG